jgi:cytochrome c oxidase assembly factor CtaG
MGDGMSGPGWMPEVPPSLGRLLAWHPQPIPLEPAACLLAALLYLLGVWRLHRRGDRWKPGRTVAFLGGIATIVEVTATGIGGYGMQLMSIHMIQHMVLSMVSPVLLLLGAPITLALRTLPAAPHGRLGAREVLVHVLHSRAAKVMTSPWFTLPLFVGSLYGLYFTSLFTTLMSTWWTHDVMLLHFLGVGLLFFYPILGIDPGPRRANPVLGILELFGGMPFHAFFGIAVMMASEPLVTTFKHPAASLGIDPLGDQTAAGGIAWAFSEIPSVIVLVALLFQWYTSEQRQARRKDRAADRDGDAELVAYNAYLASLEARGRG